MDELTMTVSGICSKDGKKFAYVTFSDSSRKAEGTIPDCRITDSHGFSEEEKEQLELFMKMKLSELKAKAAAVNPMRAIMGKD